MSARCCSRAGATTSCAGNDLSNLLEGGDATKDAFAFIAALAGFDKPLVAALHRLPIGVGATLLLHCDLVLWRPVRASRCPFLDLGLVPEAGHPYG